MSEKNLEPAFTSSNRVGYNRLRKCGKKFNRGCRLKKSLLGWLFCLGSLLWADPTMRTGTHGMVVSSATIASEVGASMLRQGGNAIDAAVATAFALAVVWPQAGNLGGGGFMVIHLADGQVRTLDFRETAPQAATRDMYLDEQGNVVSGLSTKTHLAVGVPGTVDGLLTALEAHGKLKPAQVIAPAIKLAKEGFPLPHLLAKEFEKQLVAMAEHPASMAVFSKNGQPYQAGDLWQQPDLAKTLTRIAKRGKKGFYQGKTARLLVKEMRRGKGLITRKDLRNYRSKWRSPVKGEYPGYTVWSMPPPSSGGVMLIHLLNLLEPYDLTGMGWGSASAIHLMVEAKRRAFADRAQHLGDPDFWDNPVAMFLSEDYANTRFKNFDPMKASPSENVEPGKWPEHPETTHISTADRWGNAVSCTVTLNFSYGNKMVVPNAGFLLNNEMDDFSSKPGVANAYGLLGSEANAIAPGKRMLSSMTPTILAKDGKPFLVLGSPGGSRIITTVFQVILNVIDHDMEIDDAVMAPRVHHQWKPDKIYFEPHALSHDTRTLLELRGHDDFQLVDGIGIGESHAILIKDGLLIGASDPRRARSRAAGY